MIRPLDTFSWGLNLYAQVRPSSDSLTMDQRAIIIILFRSSYRFSKHGLKTIGSNSWPFKFQIGIPLDQTRKKCGQTCLNYVRWFITMQSVKICDWNIYLLKSFFRILDCVVVPKVLFLDVLILHLKCKCKS